MTELADLAATELRQLIGTGEISPLELLASCQSRIERVDGALNAMVALDLERARHDARLAEEAVRKGKPLGWLHGLPVGVKDLARTEGLTTTYGSPLYADHIPDEDERQVAALREAGGIVLGKTNTPEFGAGANTVNPIHGATGNPFDPAKTCAGSSGGSAVALATGMVPLATGSDMGGSLRNPAAYCGVVGFRPTPGLVPNAERLLGWSPLTVDGPMARSVQDVTLLLRAMVADDARDPLASPVDAARLTELDPVDLGQLKVASSEDLGFAPIDHGIRNTFKHAIATVESSFGDVQHVDPPLAGADEAFEIMRALSFVARHREDYDNRPDLLGANIIANVEHGLLMNLADVARAMQLHTDIYRRFIAFMENFDVLICPAMSVPPFSHGVSYPDEINGQALSSYFDWLALAYGLTLTAHPVICLPCGLDHTGMPFGIQICGRRGGDRRVLQIALALEKHLAGIESLARPVPDLDALTAASV